MTFDEHSSYLKSVIDTMMDGLMVVDPKGTIVSANRAMEVLTGYSREELIGRDCSVLGCDICFRSSRGKSIKNCILFEKEGLFRERCTLKKKDGSPLVVLKNATLLKDSNGEVIGGVETLTDLSEIVERDRKIAHFQNLFTKRDGLAGIKGKSRSIQRVFELIRNAAKSDFPVIIYGETGTGKEMVASAIHRLGRRRKGPFIKVNCATLSKSLLESELFGHVKGAFTGADRSRKGRFEAADRGDIFLDEIGDIPLSTQVRLLRVLQEKEIERVGDQTPIKIDVRVISATHRNLVELIKQEKFREDLFYRLNVIPIHLPPLRERKEDIPLLVETFLDDLRVKTTRPIRGLSREAMETMWAYSWPGNVRELINALEYALVICPGEMIDVSSLPDPVISSGEKERTWDHLSEGASVKSQLIAALEQAQGKKNEAARLLGISRQALWKKIKKYGIEVKKTIRA
jgi:two-component system response regulator HydG